MLKLKIMEIWNGRDGLAALFQYQLKHGRGKISWRATWGFSLSASVIQVWDTLTAHHKVSLDVFSERINKREVGRLGDAIHLVGYSEPILRCVSLHQLWREGPYRVAQEQK